MTVREHDEAAAWTARAPRVPTGWFKRRSSLHGVTHTQRVHIHAQRLAGQLDWPRADRELVLSAALWHDIGRETDGVEPSHGRGSAARADELGLTAGLSDDRAAVVRFAIERHCLVDGGAERYAAELAAADDPARRLAQPERALRVLWLLKDADALDRVRLGCGERADPRQLRHPETIALIDFADALYLALR
jgi:HD superfamily phosphodiesterase